MNHLSHQVQLSIKRGLDIVISSVALLVLSPLLAVLGLLIWVNLGRPILFRQERPGRNARPFILVKFRSMRDATDAAGKPLPDAERLTPFGRWLRCSSLDELPELWNVLMGHMSLVGPRPLLNKYLPRYSPEQYRRHVARPGITGLAQVRGRNALSWEERFTLDVYYVDHWSLALDAHIILHTVWAVLKREGINHPGHATMSEFMGSQPGEDL